MVLIVWQTSGGIQHQVNLGWEKFVDENENWVFLFFSVSLPLLLDIKRHFSENII